MDKYNPTSWIANGPIVFNRVVAELCKTIHYTKTKPEDCEGLKVYSPSAFYPIHWSYLKNIFSPNTTIIKQLLEQVENAFGIHLYHTATYVNRILKSDPTNTYRILAEKNCPKVIAASGDEF